MILLCDDVPENVSLGTRESGRMLTTVNWSKGIKDCSTGLGHTCESLLTRMAAILEEAESPAGNSLGSFRLLLPLDAKLNALSCDILRCVTGIANGDRLGGIDSD